MNLVAVTHLIDLAGRFCIGSGKVTHFVWKRRLVGHAVGLQRCGRGLSWPRQGSFFNDLWGRSCRRSLVELLYESMWPGRYVPPGRVQMVFVKAT